jgi:hypothetical protein
MMRIKLETIISHIQAETEQSTLFIMNINHIQLQAGIGQAIFMPNCNISYVPMNWLLHIRQFLWRIKATLDIQDFWLPNIKCQHGQFIMEAFVVTKASKSELVILNNWRIYYKSYYYRSYVLRLAKAYSHTI